MMRADYLNWHLFCVCNLKMKLVKAESVVKVLMFAGGRGSDGETGCVPRQTSDWSLHGPAALKQTLI